MSWHDTAVNSLYMQMSRPLYSQDPLEMGFHLDSSHILLILRAKYARLIDGFCSENWSSACMRKAIEMYLTALQSRNSDFDQWLNKQHCDQWFPALEKGIHVFFEKGCHRCHGGKDLNNQEFGEEMYFTIRPPSLRNAAITKPYYHDGRSATLSNALRQHPKNIWRSDSSAMLSVQLPNQEEIQDLLSFLHALTDTSYLDNPLYLNPHEF